MVVLPAGVSRTEIRFGPTWDRTVGKKFSLASGIALIAIWQLTIVSRKRAMETREDEVVAAKAA